MEFSFNLDPAVWHGTTAEHAEVAAQLVKRESHFAPFSTQRSGSGDHDWLVVFDTSLIYGYLEEIDLLAVHITRDHATGTVTVDTRDVPTGERGEQWLIAQGADPDKFEREPDPA